MFEMSYYTLIERNRHHPNFDTFDLHIFFQFYSQVCSSIAIFCGTCIRNSTVVSSYGGSYITLLLFIIGVFVGLPCYELCSSGFILSCNHSHFKLQCKLTECLNIPKFAALEKKERGKNVHVLGHSSLHNSQPLSYMCNGYWN